MTAIITATEIIMMDAIMLSTCGILVLPIFQRSPGPTKARAGSKAAPMALTNGKR